MLDIQAYFSRGGTRCETHCEVRPRVVWRAAVRRQSARNASARRGAGFTLIEITIAISLFLLLLTIVFVPLNQALTVFNVGRSQISLQRAAQQTMSQIESELKKATFVYPNADIPGITDAAPYSYTIPPSSQPPYYSGTACTGTRIANTSRLDFLVAKTGANGSIEIPVKPEKYVVTLYARRLNTKTDPTDFDPFDNPVVLFRAQSPYKNDSGTSMIGMNVTSTRYPNAAGSGCNNAGWLTQGAKDDFTKDPVTGKRTPATSGNLANPDEPDLQTLSEADAGTVAGSHNVITPRGIALPVPQAQIDENSQKSYKPDLSFQPADSDGDGKIDRVTVNLTLEQYEQSNNGGGSGNSNGIPRSRQVHLSQVMDLPNIR